MDTFVLNTVQLPKNFKAVLRDTQDNEYTLKVNLKDVNDITNWVKEFSFNSHTQWIVRRSRVGNIKTSKEFVCHHSDFGKVDKDECGLNKRGVSKNAYCKARIRISINVSGSNRSRDSYVKAGLLATVRISRQHTHTLSTAATLRFLQDSTGALCEAFHDYFEDNMTASEAKHLHEHKMMLKQAKEEDYANGNLNPSARTISNWFEKWRLLNSGPRTGAKVISKLREKKSIYEAQGIILEFTEKPFAVLIVTPIMKRAHDLSSSANLAFVDTTSACDASSHSITFILSPCAAGAVPLAVLITSGQSQEAYTTAFNLLKTKIPNGFGKQGYPTTTLTDNAAAEINAIQCTWPDTHHLLCTFHVLQAVWRWLWDAANGIQNDDRIIMMNCFKNIIYAENLVEIEEAYTRCLEFHNDKWKSYINDYWHFKEKWALAYRHKNVRENHTNNYVATSIRIFKDIVLSRMKAYNVITLVDFVSTILEEYYTAQLRNFANFRNRNSFSFFQKSIRKISYLSKDEMVQIDQCLFLVPREKNCAFSHTVDTEVGSCSCPDGKFGKFCKHQAAVYQYFNIRSFNFPPITKKDRHEMAVVALGNAAPNISFYSEFEGNCSENDEIYQADTTSLPPSPPLTSTELALNKHTEVTDNELIQQINMHLREKIQTYSSSNTRSSLQKFLNRIQAISTEEMLSNLLNSVPMTMHRSVMATKTETIKTRSKKPKLTNQNRNLKKPKPEPNLR